MTKHILILGGGTGGTLTANRLRRLFPGGEVEITVVDQDDRHVYQPGLLFVPFGLTHTEDIVRPRSRQLHDGITFHGSAVDSGRFITHHFDLDEFIEAYDVFGRAADTGALKVVLTHAA